jgi:hypothetical protein
VRRERVTWLLPPKFSSRRPLSTSLLSPLPHMARSRSSLLPFDSRRATSPLRLRTPAPIQYSQRKRTSSVG